MAGSINMKRHDVNYTVKVGSRKTLTLTLNCPDTGCAVNMACVCTFNTGTWKVWRPSGVSLFCGAIVYSCRAGGVITYTLGACDVNTICEAGIWEGEVEYLDCMCVVSDQSGSFGFTVEESF